MENKIVLSIITPSYNQGDFLAESIESILDQEGDFYLDYIIIDGGSNDNSVDIIKRYERQLNEGIREVKSGGIMYRWISEKDKGQTDALIKGFTMAEGNILAWLNSDDTYMPGALQSVAASFRNDPGISFIYGDADYCDTDGKIIGRYPTEDFDLNRLAYFNFICQPSTFFRKDAFLAVGGLDTTLHYTMDYDLFIRIGKRFSGRYLPQCLSMYRLHEASKTMKADDLYKNHEEGLRLALKYYNWAPLNRVYGSCYYYCLDILPRFLINLGFPVMVAALLCTLARSIWLNRGVRREDLKLLSMNNLRKMFKDRMEILKG